MLTIMPLTRVISVIAVVYAVLVILVTLMLNKDSAAERFSTAFAGAAALNIFLMILLGFGWRKLWGIFPSLNELVFPDLNGTWKMDIRYHRQGVEKAIAATAIIKQSLLKMSMEVLSEQSESETLMMQPGKDQLSERPILFYLYRVKPKSSDSAGVGSYEGAAILKLDHAARSILEGNYFTNAFSRGIFRLTKAG